MGYAARAPCGARRCLRTLASVGNRHVTSQQAPQHVASVGKPSPPNSGGGQRLQNLLGTQSSDTPVRSSPTRRCPHSNKARATKRTWSGPRPGPKSVVSTALDPTGGIGVRCQSSFRNPEVPAHAKRAWVTGTSLQGQAPQLESTTGASSPPSTGSGQRPLILHTAHKRKCKEPASSNPLNSAADTASASGWNEEKGIPKDGRGRMAATRYAARPYSQRTGRGTSHL